MGCSVGTGGLRVRPPGLRSGHGGQRRGAAAAARTGAHGPRGPSGLPAAAQPIAARHPKVHHHWLGQEEQLARLRHRRAPPGRGASPDPKSLRLV